MDRPYVSSACLGFHQSTCIVDTRSFSYSSSLLGKIGQLPFPRGSYIIFATIYIVPTTFGNPLDVFTIDSVSTPYSSTTFYTINLVELIGHGHQTIAAQPLIIKKRVVALVFALICRHLSPYLDGFQLAMTFCIIIIIIILALAISSSPFDVFHHPMAGPWNRRSNPYPTTSSPETRTSSLEATAPQSRNVIVFVDFRELSRYCYQYYDRPPGIDLLCPLLYEHLTLPERCSLFRWRRVFSTNSIYSTNMHQIKEAVINHIFWTFGTSFRAQQLELRYQDIEGDVVQIDHNLTIIELLEEWRPLWRTREQSYLGSTALNPRPTVPYPLRLTLHKFEPHVRLP